MQFHSNAADHNYRKTLTFSNCEMFEMNLNCKKKRDLQLFTFCLEFSIEFDNKRFWIALNY